jgi:acyl dehydratase
MSTPSIGASARRTRTVTARDIELFSEITGDRNPIHYDPRVAAASRFGGIVVQGGVTSGLLNALVAEQLPGPGSVFLQVSWQFRAPVRPGDVITAEATVTAARPDKPVTTLATRITNQDGLVVLDGSAVVWRDPDVAAASAANGAAELAGSALAGVTSPTRRETGTTKEQQ